MEYTTTEIFNLVVVFIVLPLASFGAGFVTGRINGAKNLMLVKHYLWFMKGKRNIVSISKVFTEITYMGMQLTL